MSVPHLDTRVIGGRHWLLFGPYAGFSTRFLKHGSLLGLVESVRPANIKPLLSVARDNIELTEYLIGQVLQSESQRLAALEQFSQREERRLEAGGRGSTRSDDQAGRETRRLLELAPRSSPRQTARSWRCWAPRPEPRPRPSSRSASWRSAFRTIDAAGWLPKLKEIIPSYGVLLIGMPISCDVFGRRRLPF